MICVGQAELYSREANEKVADRVFSDPQSPWQRGSNENTNGLIRQYIPKGTSMKNLTQAQCDRIAEHLNMRPRKRHDFKTPEEILYGYQKRLSEQPLR